MPPHGSPLHRAQVANHIARGQRDEGKMPRTYTSKICLAIQRNKLVEVGLLWLLKNNRNRINMAPVFIRLKGTMKYWQTVPKRVRIERHFFQIYGTKLGYRSRYRIRLGHSGGWLWNHRVLVQTQLAYTKQIKSTSGVTAGLHSPGIDY